MHTCPTTQQFHFCAYVLRNHCLCAKGHIYKDAHFYFIYGIEKFKNLTAFQEEKGQIISAIFFIL